MQPYYPLILRALFSSSYSNFLRIFLSIHTFSSPYCSENRFPPFLHQLQNLRLIGIILKRPVILPPKTARTSHEIRTDFIRGHFSARVHFRSISNDTRRSPANFRSFLNKKDPKHVSVPWVLIGSFGETLGCFGGEGLTTHFSLISELSSSIKVLISLNWR